MRGGVEIVGVPGRIDAVDADEHLAAAETAGLDRVGNLLARGFLGVRRDRIFEVEDDAVGGKGLRLLQRPGVGARHIKHAAARADGHAADFIGRRQTIKRTACYSGALDRLASSCACTGLMMR